MVSKKSATSLHWYLGFGIFQISFVYLMPPRAWACQNGQYPNQPLLVFGCEQEDSIRLLDFRELFFNLESLTPVAPLRVDSGWSSMASEEPQNHWMLERGGDLESSLLLEPWDGEYFDSDLPVSYHLKVHICQQWHLQNTRHQGFTNAMKEEPNSGKPYIWPKGFAGSKSPQSSSESCNLRQVKKARGVFTILANRVDAPYQME